MEQQFPARLDNLSKVLSVVVTGVIVATGFIFTAMAVQKNLPELVVAPAVVAVALGIAAAYSVTGYSVTNGDLVVRQRIGSKVIPLSEIESAQEVITKDLGFGIRTFGSGGFLGYFGHFAYSKAGKVRMYATDRGAMILILLRSGKQIILSPEDTGSFLRTLKSADIAIKKPSS